jgi:hypothetical protein
MPYSCSLAGICEENILGGIYTTQEECQANCSPRENRDLLYIIASYNLEDTTLMAPSDKIRVIQEFTGIRLPADFPRAKLSNVILNLAGEGYPYLLPFRIFDDWILERVTNVQWWAIQFLEHEYIRNLSWRLLAVHIHFFLMVLDSRHLGLGSNVIFDTLLRKIKEFDPLLRTYEVTDHLANVLTGVWPEMRIEYNIL